MTVAPSARRGRPRSDGAERAIIDAALELLAEGQGADAITVADIARRAGVGKDTVYRRWRSKDDLLVAALASLYDRVDQHVEGPIREVLIARLTELIARLYDERNRRIFRSVLTGSPDHPQLRERFYAEVIQPRRAVTRAVIVAAVARGELRADTDPALVGALLFSPVIAQTFEPRPQAVLRGDPRTVATRIVDAALLGALPR
jgi:AcrR family transcriptional regulator